MNIIAVDPSGCTGYALGVLGARPKILYSGSRRIDLSASSYGERYDRLWKLLARLRDQQPVSVAAIVYESAFHRGGPATRLHHAYVGLVELFAFRSAIPQVIGVNPSQLKATAGHGGLTKEQMMARASADFRIEPRDDNEADALYLYENARARLWAEEKRRKAWQQGEARRARAGTETAAD